MPMNNSQKIFAAIADAVIAHEKQFRKTPPFLPYVAHPISVAFRIAKVYFDQEIIIAAILHDVLEDTNMPAKAILDKYGSKVLELVQWVTEDKMRNQEKRESWELRKKNKIYKICNSTWEAKLIVWADDIDNMHSLYSVCCSSEKKGLDTLFNASIGKKWGLYLYYLQNIFAKEKFFLERANLLSEYQDLINKIQQQLVILNIPTENFLMESI